MRKKQILQHKDRGFTLVEVIVVVVIVGILAAIALPSYTAMISRNKVEKVARSFENSLILAQRRAFVSGRSVTLCPVADITVANPACTNWSAFGVVSKGSQAGWVVFSDKNDNGELDNGETSFDKSTFADSAVAMQWTNSGSPKVMLSPRNTSGTSGTMRFYSQTGSSSSLSVWNSSSPPALLSNLHETRVKISSLGKITYEK